MATAAGSSLLNFIVFAVLFLNAEVICQVFTKRVTEILRKFAFVMKVRKATYPDIPRIMEICGEARSIMRADGNMNQWTGGYPSEDVIRNDIDKAVGYVIGDNFIEGYFAFIPGIERTYLDIEGGQWLDDVSPYCTIHRLAGTKRGHGIAQTCFDWCWSQCRNLRIDTHGDNRIMRHCIGKYGFIYCGIIHLLNGDGRLAFQKIR